MDAITTKQIDHLPAVADFFKRKLSQALDVALGLVDEENRCSTCRPGVLVFLRRRHVLHENRRRGVAGFVCGMYMHMD